MVTCPKCGGQNRTKAKFCQLCGADLSPHRTLSPAAPVDDGPSGTASGLLSGLAKVLKRVATGPEPPSPPSRPAPSPPSTRPLHAETPVTSRVASRVRPLGSGSVLTHPNHPGRRYGVVTARELERSVYYDALDLSCPNCRSAQPAAPADGLCQQCRAPLLPVLVHERRQSRDGQLRDAAMDQLMRLSAGHSSILRHQAIIQYQESTYTVVEHPGHWGVLVRGRRQRSPDEAVAGAAQVAQALAYLHRHGFAYSEVGGMSIESLVVVGGGTEVKLADLSSCVSLPARDDSAVRARVNRDLLFLGNLLFYLATGRELTRTGIGPVPKVLRAFVERAAQAQYASVNDMLTDFSLLPAGPEPGPSLKPSHGQATHPGRQHTRNEDAVVTFTFDKEQDGQAVPIGFFIVADGMGGHDAGDVASRTVNQAVTDWVIKTKVLPDLRKVTRKLTAEHVPGELLTQAIQQANDALLRRGETKGSDLGSTVTAALVIGEVATVANVGDSRAYLVRDRRLEQITQDHSLVARLVDAGVIRPEEVRTHPQRNQIYRCLGHKPVVEVDTFTVQLRHGDRLILCSDGLWEMVPDTGIQRIVEQSRSPQKASYALVEAANRAGGEDNIAVIVVEME